MLIACWYNVVEILNVRNIRLRGNILKDEPKGQVRPDIGESTPGATSRKKVAESMDAIANTTGFGTGAEMLTAGKVDMTL